MRSNKTIGRLLTTATLCGACLLAVPAANAAVLSDLLVPGATFTVGPLTFGDFTYNTACGPAPNLVTVNPWAALPLPDDTCGIQIQGPFVALPGTVCDIGLTYSVTADSAIIKDIYAKVTPSIMGTGGVIMIGENVVDALTLAVVAQSTTGWASIANDPADPPAEIGDVLVWAPPCSKVFVSKDIYLYADSASAIGATIIYQGFSIPEPGTSALLAALGLMGFALYRRRWA